MCTESGLYVSYTATALQYLSSSLNLPTYSFYSSSHTYRRRRRWVNSIRNPNIKEIGKENQTNDMINKALAWPATHTSHSSAHGKRERNNNKEEFDQKSRQQEIATTHSV